MRVHDWMVDRVAALAAYLARRMLTLEKGRKARREATCAAQACQRLAALPFQGRGSADGEQGRRQRLCTRHTAAQVPVVPIALEGVSRQAPGATMVHAEALMPVLLSICSSMGPESDAASR